ncbi:MAG: class I SAM-dependent methyltransferase [Halobaculum sp.]
MAESESVPTTAESDRPHPWSAGRYPTMAPNLLPAIARLTNACGIDPGDDVLDVGCGTGNAALTARRSGAHVAGVDLSRGMLALAERNAATAGYGDIDWLLGNAQQLPVRTGAFDVTLSNFGHVFAPDAEAASAELVRATKSGGRVGFTAWSPDGVAGELTQVLTEQLDTLPSDPWSHLQWGDPSFVRDHLPDAVELDFQRRMLQFRYASPAHFWEEFAEESGPLSPVLQRIDDPDVLAAVRENALGVLEEWFGDNAVRVEYLQCRGVVE